MRDLVRGPSTWLALLGLLPLALLIGGLGLHQVRQERAALLAERQRLAAEQHFAVATVLGEAGRQLRRMETRMRLSMAEQPRLETRAGELKAVKARGIAATGWSRGSARTGELIGLPDLAVVATGPVAAALDLLGPLEVEAQVGALSSWSYFFSAAGDFITIFPGASLDDFLAAAPPVADARGLIDHWLSYDVFRLGTPDANPDREPYWTAPYDDAGGAGRMVSHAMPVYDGDRFVGVVGADLLLSSLSGVLDHMAPAFGQLGLVTDAGDVLTGQEEGRDRLVAAAATPGSPAFVRQGDDWALVQPFPGTPFRLVTLVPEAEMTALILPRIAGHALVLTGAAASLLTLIAALDRRYLRPGLRLADYVEAAAGGGGLTLPELSGPWRTRGQAIARALRSSREDRAALAASEARYRTVVNTQTELVARHTPEGRATFVNDAYCRQLGQTREDALASEVSQFDYIAPECLAEHEAHVGSLTPDHPTATIVIKVHLPGKGARWEEWTDTGLFDAQGRLIELQSVGRDVTAKVDAEAAAGEIRTRLADFLTHAPVAILARDAEGRFTLLNPAAERLLRRSADQAIGRRLADLMPGPEAEAADREVAEILATGTVRIDAQHHPQLAPYLDSTFIRFPLRAPDGRATGVGVFVVDETARKAAEAELSRQRDAVYQSEKLAALGSLLAGVAHELNNPLSIVVGYAGMLHDLAPDEPTRRRAGEVARAADRCARIVRTFLAMARSKPAERREVDLDQLIDAALELAAYGLRSYGVEVIRTGCGTLCIHADGDQIHQVLMNVILNAQQAMTTVDGPRRLSIGAQATAEGVVLEIADTGVGLEATVAERVFEPFFTTKPQGIGTGIGLAVSRGIVEAHGGTIALTPRPEGGALCRIFLPFGVLGAGPAPADAPSRPVAAGRILVVDDEPAIGDFLAEALARDGIEAVVARSGAEAMDLVARQRFDVVLTDLRMPDLGGDRLASRLIALDPRLAGRILVMTGDALSAERAAGMPILEKPLAIAAVRAALAPLLAGRIG